ncbi:hypothetical protein, partial [uncultured Bilophila sp.]|uniref:hypothetical protein n=6 Tax=Bilophila TaxID=35832 RepID=UPI0025957E0B
EGTLLEKGFPLPSPNPTPLPPKTFVFIESLFAGSAGILWSGRMGKWFPAVKLEMDQGGNLHRQCAEIRFSEDADQQANSGGKASVSPPHQSKVFGEGAGGGAF